MVFPRRSEVVVRLGLLVLIIALVLTAVPGVVAQVPNEEAQGGDDEPSPALLTLRVGYTAFDSPQGLRQKDPHISSVLSYLAWLSRQSRELLGDKFTIPVDFDVYPGNYYQVREWLLAGQLDGAVVSPFVALLLMEDTAAIPVLALEEKEEVDSCHFDGEGQAAKPWDGYRPVVALRRGPPKEGQSATAGRSAEEELKRVLQDWAEWAQAESKPGQSPERVEAKLHLVNHLSTSGFLFPVLYAKEVLDEALPVPQPEKGTTTPSPEQLRVKAARERFWQHFFASVRFSLHHGSRLPSEDGEEAFEPDSRSFFFSYSNQQPVSDQPVSASNSDAAEWGCYWLAGPEIPPKVLVIRPELQGRVLVRASQGASWEALKPPSGDSRWENIQFQVFPELGARDLCTSSEDSDEASGDDGATHLEEGTLEWEYHRLCQRMQSLQVELGERWRHWFEEGRFEFSIEDTLAILSQDEKIHGDPGLSLVLPGGGVKSVYQAVILDRLYQSGWLRNWRATGGTERNAGSKTAMTLDDTAEEDETSDEALKVEYIIGTSGGALMGFFAASIKDRSTCLTSLWLRRKDTLEGSIGCPTSADASKSLVPQVSAGKLFEALGFLRWVSLFWLLCVILLVSSAYRQWSRNRQERKGAKKVGDGSSKAAVFQAPPIEKSSDDTTARQPPGRFLWIPLILVVFAPVLARTVRSTNVEHVPWFEGLLYVILLMLCHFVLMCVKRQEAPAKSLPWKLWVYIVVSLILVIVPLALRGVGFFDTGSLYLSGTVMAGLLLVALAQVFVPKYSPRYRWYRPADHLLGLSILVVFGAFTYLVLWVLSVIGLVSLLELTPGFWLWLTLVGIALALIISWLLELRTQQRPQGRQARALQFAFAKQNLGIYAGSPRRTFFWFCFMGLVLWNILNAPALYSNENMVDHYRDTVAKHFDGIELEDLKRAWERSSMVSEGDRQPAIPLPLQTALVVTTVQVDEVEQDQPVPDDLVEEEDGHQRTGDRCIKDFRPGEHFLCFDEAGGACCREPDSLSPIERRLRDERWNVQEPLPARVAAATLASGSPFPVFPSHLVPLQPASATVEALCSEENGAEETGHREDESKRGNNSEELDRPDSEPCRVPLVDGGYTNLIPLSAAALLGNRRVLVVHSEPRSVPMDDREDEGFQWDQALGRLVRYSGRLFPFLFSRSQELDRRLGEEMMVVSLAPWAGLRDDDNRFPFLADFREKTVREVWKWAVEDLNQDRLLGRVESWGLPGEPKLMIRSGRIQEEPTSIDLSKKGWNSSAYSSLLQRCTDLLSYNGRRRGAVVDLDRTLFDGEFDDILSAEVVLDQIIQNRWPSFWAAIGDPALGDRRSRVLWSPASTWPPTLEQRADWDNDFSGLYADLLHRVAELEAPRAPRLMAEQNPSVIREFTRQVLRRAQQRHANDQVVVNLGTQSKPLRWQIGLAIHEEVRDLIKGLQDLDWPVWLVGRGPRQVVEEVARELDVPTSHALGIEPDVGSEEALQSWVDRFLQENIHLVVTADPGLLVKEMEVLSKDENGEIRAAPLAIFLGSSPGRERREVWRKNGVRFQPPEVFQKGYLFTRRAELNPASGGSSLERERQSVQRSRM